MLIFWTFLVASDFGSFWCYLDGPFFSLAYVFLAGQFCCWFVSFLRLRETEENSNCFQKNR